MYKHVICIGKALPLQIIRNTDRIVKLRKILQNPEKCRVNTEAALEKLESPVPVWIPYIELCLKAKPE
jgi:hypothetical protein